MITQQNCRLLNNALLNYCSPPGQVLLCFVRRERTQAAAKGKEAWSSAILRSQAWRKYHFSIRGDQSELLMCYTSRGITASGRAGTAEGETHWCCTCRGIRSISCTWKHFPKSAVVGEEDGAVQRKAPAGFLPVHRCRSPHIRLIQSHRHQMP